MSAVWSDRVLLAARGECTYTAKARIAQAGGAVALLVYDPRSSEADAPLNMVDDGNGASVEIAVLGITRAVGEALRRGIDESAYGLDVSIEAFELAISTTGDPSNTAFNPLRWKSANASAVARCASQSDEQADLCIPFDRALPLSAGAFDNAEWAHLWRSGGCDAPAPPGRGTTTASAAGKKAEGDETAGVALEVSLSAPEP